MATFVPLTPDLRTRLAKSAARALLRQRERHTAPADLAITETLSSAPNKKAVVRAANRLRRTRGVAEVSVWREGSAVTLACLDSYVTGIDRARPSSAGGLLVFESTALAYRTSLVTYWKRFEPQRRTMSVVFFDVHAIARFIERGPFDPRKLHEGQLVSELVRAHASIRSGLVLVEAAELSGRLAPALAATFPCPCPSGGLWVVEPSTSGDESWDATAVTYLGASSLSSEQNGFVTACGDGDFIGALLAYPNALRRGDPITPGMEAKLAHVGASLRTPG